ncbi:MAG: hypothetical protein AB1540_13135 [Bdellovibrionota bacterium]
MIASVFALALAKVNSSILRLCMAVVVFSIALPAWSQHKTNRRSALENLSRYEKVGAEATPPPNVNFDNEAAKAEAGFPHVDPKSVTSVDVKCREEGPVIMGNHPCRDKGATPGYLSRVEKFVKEALAIENYNYYIGSTTNFATGIGSLSATPVCNISQGEEHRNLLPKNSGCGKWCNVRVETSSILGLVTVGGDLFVDDKNGGCSREYGWFRGAFVQVMNYYKEKVFAEFRNKKVQLVDIEGVKPCAGIAADVIRAQAATDNALERVVAVQGIERAAAASCPHLEKSRGLASLGKKTPFENELNSHGACFMGMAQLRLASLWSGFLGCEIRWRASRDFEQEFGSIQQWVNETKVAISDRCKSFASSCEKGNGDSALAGNQSCDDKMRTRLFMQCYQKEVPLYLKNKLQRYNTSTPAEFPQDFSKNDEPTGDFGISFAALNVKALLSAMSRRRRNRKLGRALVALVAMALAFSGCSGDDPEIACQPCNPSLGSQQTGCIYQACMQTMYFCLQFDRITRKESKTNVVDPNVVLDREFGENATNTICITAKDQKSDVLTMGKLREEKFQAEIQEAYRTSFNATTRTYDCGDDCLSSLDPNNAQAQARKTWEAFLETHKLKAESIFKAAGDCREIGGLSRTEDDLEKYAETSGSASNNVSRLNSHDIAALQKVVGQLGVDAGGFGAGANCPQTPGTTNIDGRGGVTLDELAGDLAGLNRVLGGENLEIDEHKPSLAGGKGGGSSTAADRGGSPNKPSLSSVSRAPGSQSGLPTVALTGSSASQGGAQGMPQFKGLEGGGKQAGLEGSPALGEHQAGTLTAGTAFGESAAGGGGGAQSKSFSFGSQPDPSINGGGATDVKLGGASGPGSVFLGGVDLDSYFARVGKTSLFEVVNKRMNKWGNEIEVERQKGEFRRLSR